MSDFAPFVAAHMRDKAVDDLLKGNKQLYKALHLMNRVEITGPIKQRTCLCTRSI